jgi:hypothetical protein
VLVRVPDHELVHLPLTLREHLSPSVEANVCSDKVARRPDGVKARRLATIRPVTRWWRNW